MKNATSVIAISVLVGLLSGCGNGKRSAPDVLQPPTGSGLVATDLSGTWRITEVDPRLWITRPDGSDRVPDPFPGLVPAVGATIEIAGSEFTVAAGLPLRREAFDRSTIITSYLNQVDDRVGIYTMRRHTAPIMLDGGGMTLQMAMGTIDRDHLLGVVYQQFVSPFVRPGDPIEVMAQVRLERAQ